MKDIKTEHLGDLNKYVADAHQCNLMSGLPQLQIPLKATGILWQWAWKFLTLVVIVKTTWRSLSRFFPFRDTHLSKHRLQLTTAVVLHHREKNASSIRVKIYFIVPHRRRLWIGALPLAASIKKILQTDMRHVRDGDIQLPLNDKVIKSYSASE